MPAKLVHAMVAALPFTKSRRVSLGIPLLPPFHWINHATNCYQSGHLPSLPALFTSAPVAEVLLSEIKKGLTPPRTPYRLVLHQG